MRYHDWVRVVIDTSVFVSAILGHEGSASREVLRRSLVRELLPAMGTSLFLEYESVVSRPSILEQSRLDQREVEELLDAFASVCTWTTVYYRWRPSLVDEADHHLLELAIASGADAIVTKNVRHLRSGELRFSQLRILRPEELTKDS
ncbi:MAG: putative toxin-antitoxin system toxin component, PIN family [Acidobacteriota bacterium]